METTPSPRWFVQPRFYGLLVAALVLGGLIGALTGLFYTLIHHGIAFLWEHVPHALGIAPTTGWYIVAVCLIGGLLVGLCQHYLGDYPQEMRESLEAFRHTGRFDTAHVPQGMITSFVSLISGASLGPEAPLFGLGGGLSSLATDILRRLGRNPDGSASAVWVKPVHRILLGGALLAGGLGFVRISVWGGALGSGGMFDASAYQFQPDHLLWAIPAALIGVVLGYVFLALFKATHAWGQSLGKQRVFRALIGGGVLAVLGATFPLVLRSGQESLIELQLHSGEISWVTLALSGLLKIAAVSMLLSSGWKGGTFLPLMSAGAMVSLLISALVPSVPALVPMVAAMAAIAVITVNNAVIVLVLMLVLAPISAVGVSLVGVGVAAVVLRLRVRGVPQEAAAAAEA